MEAAQAAPFATASDIVEAGFIKRARGGDVSAFEEIVKRHQRRVYGVARRIVQRHDVADDVTQEAFLKAFQALSSFDLSRPFAPWICRIATNLAINHVRSPRAREEEFDEAHAETLRVAEDPASEALHAEADRELQRAMASLPGDQRAVLTLRVVEELSYKDIALTLGISIGTVMSRLSRAREKLRLALLPYLGGSARRTGGVS